MISCHQAVLRCFFSNFLNLIFTWGIFYLSKRFAAIDEGNNELVRGQVNMEDGLE